MTAFAFAHLNPPAVERYLTALAPNGVWHNEMHAILRAPGAFAPAAAVLVLREASCSGRFGTPKNVPDRNKLAGRGIFILVS